jgi:prolyl oligopeptidase
MSNFLISMLFETPSRRRSTSFMFLLAAPACQLATLCCLAQPVVHYPVTRKVDQVDTFFGVRVEDPYRWFENDTTAEVKEWVKEENKVTTAYLSAIPFREALHRRITELSDYPYYSRPIHVGDYYFYLGNTGLQPQEVIFRKKGQDGKPEVFLDANTLSADGTTMATLSNYSEDKKYIIVNLSIAGSDLQNPMVYEVATGKLLPDRLAGVKVSSFCWKGDGFYYSRYPIMPKGKELTMLNTGHSIYYHVLATDQSADTKILSASDPKSFNQAFVTENHRFLLVNSFSGRNLTDWYFRDFQSADMTLRLFIKGELNVTEDIIDDSAGLLLLLTNRHAPNYKIALVDPQHPDTANWQTLIPEQDAPIDGAVTAYGKIFVTYSRDVLSSVYQYNYSGRPEKEIILPDLGTARVAPGLKEDADLYYSFSSYLYPVTVFRYDIRTGQTAVYYKRKSAFDPANYESKEVFYPGKDGTRIPLFLVYKKGLVKDGQRPTLLTAYGGYAINLLPGFQSPIFPLLDAGGIAAFANIRGGGEYGEQWHQAGMLLKTRNRFDDFIAAAEWLIREKYTSPQKLGIEGSSHGGCLVASTMLQRPDLFRVVIPNAGTLDMLRFNRFTVGWNWTREYGNPDSAADFRNLIAYSPVHNIKAGIRYPAVLVLTADHDDRVVPMHSYKFAAQLQARQAGPDPVLLYVDTNSAHGASSYTKYIDHQSDMMAFFFYNTQTTMNESPAATAFNP